MRSRRGLADRIDMDDTQIETVLSHFPDHWEPWQVEAAIARAFGASDRKLADVLKKSRVTIAGFLTLPATCEIVRNIRRETAGRMYGRALKLVPKAMGRLRKLLDAEQPGHQLQAVNMVRKIVGDSVNADGAQALRELKALLKGGS